MEGAVVEDTHDTGANAPDEHPQETTTDFGVLHEDLAVTAETRKAPNPLRAANPERLEQYRKGVNGVVAARRAGFADR